MSETPRLPYIAILLIRRWQYEHDSKGILKLMQEVAVDYGKHATAGIASLELLEKSLGPTQQ